MLPKDSCDEHVSSYCNFNIPVSLIFRYEKIKERNEPLVEFLKTNEVKVCILIPQRSTCIYQIKWRLFCNFIYLYYQWVIYCIGLCLQDYLLDILREKKKSEKHTTYKFGLSKARDALKNPGFGPIADESQVSVELYSLWLCCYKLIVPSLMKTRSMLESCDGQQVQYTKVSNVPL